MNARETYRQALFTRLQALQADGAVITCDRRARLLDDMNDGELPALFVMADDETVTEDDGAPPAHTLGAQVLIYTANPDPNTSAEVVLDDLLDAVEGALAPDSWATGTCTLGGLVQHCRIEGDIKIFAGALGQRAAAVIPVKILVP
ncbi:MAG: hypothetical protein M0006_03325 [Magnetospirillum sp.]|nr:hypothetical protein [Magnetospirillum sp.]